MNEASVSVLVATLVVKSVAVWRFCRRSNQALLTREEASGAYVLSLWVVTLVAVGLVAYLRKRNAPTVATTFIAVASGLI